MPNTLTELLGTWKEKNWETGDKEIWRKALKIVMQYEDILVLPECLLKAYIMEEALSF